MKTSPPRLGQCRSYKVELGSGHPRELSGGKDTHPGTRVGPPHKPHCGKTFQAEAHTKLLGFFVVLFKKLHLQINKKQALFFSFWVMRKSQLCKFYCH
jgi:hypothetical protein